MVIVVVGKTCSGKDTVAHYIEEKYGFDFVVTYTTRPMREDDVQGVSHHFITAEERENYKDVFSPTFINGYEYFTTLEQFKGDKVVCILDPLGVVDLHKSGISCEVLYVDCPDAFILARARERGDDIGVVSSRLEDEHERFEAFKLAGAYDGYINNIQTVDVLKSCVDTCMLAIASKHFDSVSSCSPTDAFENL